MHVVVVLLTERPIRQENRIQGTARRIGVSCARDVNGLVCALCAHLLRSTLFNLGKKLQTYIFYIFKVCMIYRKGIYKNFPSEKLTRWTPLCQLP